MLKWVKPRDLERFVKMHFLLLLPGAFFAPVIHEWVKARVSGVLGDPSPRKGGFISCNPLRFFEPIGFIFMLYFQVGWGRPVPTSPFMYRNKRAGTILTYSAPIVANLLVGMLTIFFLSLFRDTINEWVYAFGGAVSHLRRSAELFGRLNIRLAVFNLIPVYPMAASKLLQLFVSPRTAMQLNNYEKRMQILLFLFLIFGVLEMIVLPVSNIFVRAVTF